LNMRNLVSSIIVFFVVFSSTAVSAELQILPTGVRLTILNSLGNIVENAKVTMYKNWDDYENEENAIAGPAFTDKKGRVTFKNLEDKQYYVKAVKGDKSNYGEGEQTNKLTKGKINKINIIIQ
jgi:hypothetical protein